jgi:hypothetical protein
LTLLGCERRKAEDVHCLIPNDREAQAVRGERKILACAGDGGGVDAKQLTSAICLIHHHNLPIEHLRRKRIGIDQ